MDADIFDPRIHGGQSGVGYSSPKNMVIGGVPYRTQDGKTYRIDGNKLIPITDQNQLFKLEQQYQQEQQMAQKLNQVQPQNEPQSNSSLLIIGAVVLLFLLMKGR